MREEGIFKQLCQRPHSANCLAHVSGFPTNLPIDRTIQRLVKPSHASTASIEEG